MRIRVKNNDPKIVQKTSTFLFCIFSPIVVLKNHPISMQKDIDKYQLLLLKSKFYLLDYTKFNIIVIHLSFHF